MRPNTSRRKCGTDAALIETLAQQNEYFPQANDVMHPVNRFFIGGRWLNLYAVDGRTPSTSFSLYWQNENNPTQHAMTYLEVFAVLANLLSPLAHYIQFEDEEFMYVNNWVCMATPYCVKPSNTLGLTLEEVNKINTAGHILTPGKLSVDEEIARYVLDHGLGTVVCDNCRKSLTP